MEAGKSRIIRTELDGSALTPVVTGIDRGGDILLDVANNLMYWVQEVPGKIWRSDLNGMNKVQLVTTDDFPDDLRIDLAGGWIYWRTSNGISRANLSGQNKTTVLNASTTAFDLKNNQIYYLKWTNEGLFRANLDGSGSTIISTDNQFYNAYSLDINIADSTVYFLSANYGQMIKKAKWDGTQPLVLKERDVYMPGQINYNPATETFLWVNKHSSFQGDTSSSIKIWNKTSGAKPFTFIKEAPSSKRYLSAAVDWKAGNAFWAESSTTTLIKRIKLTGAGASNLVDAGLQFPLYQKFNPQNGRLYWTDYGADKIMSILPNGTDIQTIAAGLDGAGGFDFDTINQKIYVAAGGSRDIKRMNYDGTQVESIVSGLFSPISVAVNPLLDEIYWIDGSKLAKSKKDGTQITNVITPVAFTSYQDLIFVATPNSSAQQIIPIDAKFHYANYQALISFEQAQTAEISIFSVLGQKVSNEMLANQTEYLFDASGLTDGMYYLHVRNTKGQAGVFGFAVQR